MRNKRTRFAGILPRSFTLMFIPHSKESIYRVQIPTSLVKLLLVILICFMIAASYCTIKYFKMKENMSELQMLRSVNKKQEKKLDTLETKTDELQKEMLQLEQLKKNVRLMLKEGKLSGQGSGEVVEKYSSPLASRGSSRISTAGEVTGSLDKPESEKSGDWEERCEKLDNKTVALSTNVERLRGELELLQEDVAERKAFLAAKPSGLPVAGRISSGYGNRKSPVTGRREFHPAIDIAASYGAKIVATGKGEVICAGYKPGYGKTIIIDHGYGYRTLYSHNSSHKVRVGDTVERGDCIALVGSTGTSTGPHLHYEVILYGKNVNPEEYLN